MSADSGIKVQILNLIQRASEAARGATWILTALALWPLSHLNAFLRYISISNPSQESQSQRHMWEYSSGWTFKSSAVCVWHPPSEDSLLEESDDTFFSPLITA